MGKGKIGPSGSFSTGSIGTQNGFYAGMRKGTCAVTKQCGRRHDVDGVRMSEPQISKFLKMTQGYINTALKKELAQKFVDRNRVGTETAGDFLKRDGV